MYSLLSSHSNCDRTFYCPKTMPRVAALTQHCNFTRQYSVPRTARWVRDLPLSVRGTGADLQHAPLRLGWAALPLPLSRSCPSVHRGSAPAFGCAESCCNTDPSRAHLTLSCFRLTGEPSTHVLGSQNSREGARCSRPPLAYCCCGARSHCVGSLLKESSVRV